MIDGRDWWPNHSQPRSQRHQHLILRGGTRLHCRAVSSSTPAWKIGFPLFWKIMIGTRGNHLDGLNMLTQTGSIGPTRACGENMWKQGSHIPMGVAEKGIYPPNAFLFIGNMMMNHQTTSSWGCFPGIFRYQTHSFRQHDAIPKLSERSMLSSILLKVP